MKTPSVFQPGYRINYIEVLRQTRDGPNRKTRAYDVKYHCCGHVCNLTHDTLRKRLIGNSKICQHCRERKKEIAPQEYVVVSVGTMRGVWYYLGAMGPRSGYDTSPGHRGLE